MSVHSIRDSFKAATSAIEGQDAYRNWHNKVGINLYIAENIVEVSDFFALGGVCLGGGVTRTDFFDEFGE